MIGIFGICEPLSVQNSGILNRGRKHGASTFSLSAPFFLVNAPILEDQYPGAPIFQKISSKSPGGPQGRTTGMESFQIRSPTLSWRRRKNVQKNPIKLWVHRKRNEKISSYLRFFSCAQNDPAFAPKKHLQRVEALLL